MSSITSSNSSEINNTTQTAHDLIHIIGSAASLYQRGLSVDGVPLTFADCVKAAIDGTDEDAGYYEPLWELVAGLTDGLRIAEREWEQWMGVQSQISATLTAQVAQEHHNGNG